MTLFDALDDAHLRRAFGAGTLARGEDYARSGKVRSWTSSTGTADLVLLEGHVDGSAAVPYHVHVTVVDHPRDLWVDARCDTNVLTEKAMEQGYLLAPGSLFSPSQLPSTRMRVNVANMQDAGLLRFLEREIGKVASRP